MCRRGVAVCRHNRAGGELWSCPVLPRRVYNGRCEQNKTNMPERLRMLPREKYPQIIPGVEGGEGAA